MGIALTITVFSGIAGASTTYTVTFSATGFGKSFVNWSVTFNNVPKSTTSRTISFTSVSAGTYYWSLGINPVSSGKGAQYVGTPDSGSMTVPGEIRQVVAFQLQYGISLLTKPAAAGYTDPAATTFVDPGQPAAVSATSYPGYAFANWSSSGSAVLASNLGDSTQVTVNGPATVTAVFRAIPYSLKFNEIGLPSGTNWTTDLYLSSITSNNSTQSFSGMKVGSYLWSIPSVSAGAGIQYVATPSYGDISPPYQTTQTIVFTEQFLVNLTTNPSNGGSTDPSGSIYADAGSSIVVSAIGSSSMVFSSWNSSTRSIGFTSSLASTTAVIRGPGTITANFANGTSCSICTVSFREVGLPGGTLWGVDFNNSFYGSTTNSLSIKRVNGSYPYGEPWSAAPIAGGGTGVRYAPQYPTGSIMDVPYQTVQTISFVAQYYVTVDSSPSIGGVGNPNSGWFNGGSTIALWSTGAADAKFKSWSTSVVRIGLANASQPSTFARVLGPGNVTANFAPPSGPLTFEEYGLPLGTAWGVTFDGTQYWSKVTSFRIPSITDGYYYWLPASPIAAGTGIQYVSTVSSSYIYVPYQNVQVVSYSLWDWVTIRAGGSAGGTVSPAGGAWYLNGTTLPISAINGTVNFTGWSSSGTTVSVQSKSQAATYARIGGPGTITARFV